MAVVENQLHDVLLLIWFQLQKEIGASYATFDLAMALEEEKVSSVGIGCLVYLIIFQMFNLKIESIDEHSQISRMTKINFASQLKALIKKKPLD